MNTSVYYIFLDDERWPKNVTWVNLPPFPWTVVRNYKDFVSTIDSLGMPLFISFDHDLGAEHYNPAMYRNNKEDYNRLYDTFKDKTGYDCAKWAVEYCMDNRLKFPEYAVHSMNPIGKENIESYIENYKRAASLL
jgi:hypothetical protein